MPFGGSERGDFRHPIETKSFKLSIVLQVSTSTPKWYVKERKKPSMEILKMTLSSTTKERNTII